MTLKRKCRYCQEEFQTEHDLQRHLKAMRAEGKHPRSTRKRTKRKSRSRIPSLPKEDLVSVAIEVLDDLPDGAFFAAANDLFGLQPEDFCE